MALELEEFDICSWCFKFKLFLQYRPYGDNGEYPYVDDEDSLFDQSNYLLLNGQISGRTILWENKYDRWYDYNFWRFSTQFLATQF